MKNLKQYIAESKALHQNVNIAERLIIFPSQVDEKLVINKSYKNINATEELFDNIDFEHVDNDVLRTGVDIFSIMVDYIHDHNVRSFSDFDSYRHTCRKNNNVYLVIFNKRIKEMNIFQKIYYDEYKVFTIHKDYADPYYFFDKSNRRITAMYCLNKSNTWNNADDVEYYEISEITFDDISELYDELIKK